MEGLAKIRRLREQRRKDFNSGSRGRDNQAGEQRQHENYDSREHGGSDSRNRQNRNFNQTRNQNQNQNQQGQGHQGRRGQEQGRQGRQGHGQEQGHMYRQTQAQGPGTLPSHSRDSRDRDHSRETSHNRNRRDNSRDRSRDSNRDGHANRDSRRTNSKDGSYGHASGVARNANERVDERGSSMNGRKRRRDEHSGNDNGSGNNDTHNNQNNRGHDRFNGHGHVSERGNFSNHRHQGESDYKQHRSRDHGGEKMQREGADVRRQFQDRISTESNFQRNQTQDEQRRKRFKGTDQPSPHNMNSGMNNFNKSNWGINRGNRNIGMDRLAVHGSHSNSSQNLKHIEAPKNDYSQNFVDAGDRPQNFIRDNEIHERYDSYPKLQELVTLKNAHIDNNATPPTYLHTPDLKNFDLTSLGGKFDVILVDPPWEEYRRRCPGAVIANQNRKVWTPEEIMSLRLDQIAGQQSFVFLWVGSAEGLWQGRHILKKWGYRRCEDICWVKCNKGKKDDKVTNHLVHDQTIFQRTTEHCLMGIRGTVRRSYDGHLIHANVDTDVIVSEEPEYGSVRKPTEMYEMIERFCLGRRRLELFGEDHNIRRGWLTIGDALTNSNFERDTYQSLFSGPSGHLLPPDDQIERKRPKSPPRRGKGGKGRGGGKKG